LQGQIDKEDLIRIFKLFHALGLALYVSELQEEALLQGLKEFQEHLGGRLTIMILDKLGKGVEVHEMDPELIGKALQILQFWEEQKTI